MRDQRRLKDGGRVKRVRKGERARERERDPSLLNFNLSSPLLFSPSLNLPHSLALGLTSSFTLPSSFECGRETETETEGVGEREGPKPRREDERKERKKYEMK